MSDITDLLTEANRGDEASWNKLFAEFYGDLRKLAHARLRRNRVPTLLDTTVLVHEAYVRFAKGGRVHINDRSHFMAYAARVMRSIIVDRLREQSAQKAGGQPDPPLQSGANEILQVHEALNHLATLNERLARIVEMRYFAGMTEMEIADVLGVTERTVRRDWQKARIVLAATLSRELVR